jgi:hypothetical protein
MTGVTTTELVLLLVHGAREPRRLRGTLEFHDDGGLWETEPFNLWQPVQPALPRGSTEELPPWEPIPDGTLEVAVDGHAFRVREPGHDPWTVSDGTTVWTFERGGEVSAVPLVSDRFLPRPVGYRDYLPPFQPSWVATWITAPLRWFLEPVAAVEVGGQDAWAVAGAARESQFLGRSAWVLPLRRRGSELQLTLERSSGLVLEVRTATTRVAWSALDTDPSFRPEEFRHDGPVHTSAEETARGHAEHEAQRRAGAENWTRLVGPTEFTVVADVPLDLTVEQVHAHDPETGEFRATLTGNSVVLERRLRGTSPDGEGQHHGTVLRWSTPRYDWVVQGLPVDLTDRGRQAVAGMFPAD